ncbi:chaplin ChpF [Streptomyces capparidis]
MSRIAKAAAVTATAGLVLAGAAAPAFADAEADAAIKESPGVISGNAIQIPLHVPINICGITVDIIALLNPAFGNVCINSDDEHASSKTFVKTAKLAHGEFNEHHTSGEYRR